MTPARTYNARVNTLKNRVLPTGVALACLAMLTAAARTSPDGRGHGTHEQLGMPPCAWPGMFDMPCPTCGMTTAFAHTANLDLGRAFVTQPMGAVLALVCAVAFWVALHSALTGSRALGAAGSMLSGKGTWVAIIGLLAAWGYKVVTWGG